MKTYFFKSALCHGRPQLNSHSNAAKGLPSKPSLQTSNGASWLSNVLISVADGCIVDVLADAEPTMADEQIAGVAIPAMVNVHSHAFQRGFAGLSEYRTVANDSFWTWRKLMYGYVLKLTPEDVYVIAKQLYLEMILAGYSWVGEFHYLHNDQTGASYSNPAEMADAVTQAARDTGLGICLLPVLYQRGGFDGKPMSAGQRRFGLSTDAYLSLLDSCRSRTANLPNANLGIAIHSLRAASEESIRSVLQHRATDLPGCPVHIHVAEQTQEVDDCLAATGQRPVEHLLTQYDVNADWCLIHATHMNEIETLAMANSGATAGLCPTTEANLGDGFFPARLFLAQHGSIAIGSDSHCSVDVRDELRTLEYGQRLLLRQRAVLGTEQFSVGRRLYESAAVGGATSIGVKTGSIAKGSRADLLVVDDHSPVIAGAQADRLLDCFVFANAGNSIAKRMLGGVWIETEKLETEWKQSSEAFYQLNQRIR
ncbi:MAG: formimidoylglutamate deiminase [Mariniblastus sp.]|jgi:formimidoylglutamate deiminase